MNPRIDYADNPGQRIMQAVIVKKPQHHSGLELRRIQRPIPGNDTSTFLPFIGHFGSTCKPTKFTEPKMILPLLHIAALSGLEGIRSTVLMPEQTS